MLKKVLILLRGGEKSAIKLQVQWNFHVVDTLAVWLSSFVSVVELYRETVVVVIVTVIIIIIIIIIVIVIVIIDGNGGAC
jgi:hypothetical protein